MWYVYTVVSTENDTSPTFLERWNSDWSSGMMMSMKIRAALPKVLFVLYNIRQNMKYSNVNDKDNLLFEIYSEINRYNK